MAKKAMGREVKIGVAVIGSLLVVLGGVLYYRLAGGAANLLAQPPDAPPGVSNAAPDASLAAQPTLMTPAPVEAAAYVSNGGESSGGPQSNGGPLPGGAAQSYPTANNAYPAAYNDANRERQEPPQSYLADSGAPSANGQPVNDPGGQSIPSDRRSSPARDEDSVNSSQAALVGDTSARGDGSGAVPGSSAGQNGGRLSDSQVAVAQGSYDGSASVQTGADPADTANLGAGGATNDPQTDQANTPSASVRPAGGGFVPPRRFRGEAAPVSQGVAPPSGYSDDGYTAGGGASAPGGYSQDPGYASPVGQPPITAVAAQAPIAQGASEPGQYIVQPNDNFWIISEKVYGAGAFFKALHRFNAADYPQSRQLQVGDVVAVPPTAVLRQKFPDLCPKPNRERVASQTQPVAAGPRHRLDARIYVVEQGDTLFDVARRQLGKASRWPEIYELNRATLGEDFDYLRAGTELVMPSEGQAQQDTLTRRPSDRFQR